MVVTETEARTVSKRAVCIILECYLYRLQRSCGQGNIFTPVCHSFCSQGGGCLSACWDTTHTPGSTPPEHTHPPRPHPPPFRSTPPPRKQTPAYGLRAAGTHPTGMHSCVIKVYTRHAKTFVQHYLSFFCHYKILK